MYNLMAGGGGGGESSLVNQKQACPVRNEKNGMVARKLFNNYIKTLTKDSSLIKLQSKIHASTEDINLQIVERVLLNLPVVSFIQMQSFFFFNFFFA